MRFIPIFALVLVLLAPLVARAADPKGPLD